jgi:ABC-type Fe3+ transport system permease subunit
VREVEDCGGLMEADAPFGPSEMVAVVIAAAAVAVPQAVRSLSSALRQAEGTQ